MDRQQTMFSISELCNSVIDYNGSKAACKFKVKNRKPLTLIKDVNLIFYQLSGQGEELPSCISFYSTIRETAESRHGPCSTTQPHIFWRQFIEQHSSTQALHKHQTLRNQTWNVKRQWTSFKCF